MLRGLVLLLLLANAAFFVWSRGWLEPLLPAPSSADREPERLAQQVRPLSITVLNPKAAAQAAVAASSAIDATENLPAAPGAEASTPTPPR